MKASVFVGVSLDGFIARADGGIDWLEVDGDEDTGFDAFYATVDALVMGRHTYETALGFDQWPYGSKPVYVLSSRPPAPSPAGADVRHRSGEPASIVDHLAAEGIEHAYVDGGITVQRFLRAGLIDRITVTTLPILIGDGIRLFGRTDADIRLRHIGTRAFANGLVQTEYAIDRGEG